MPAVTHLYDLSFLKIILNIFFFSFLDSPCLKNDKTFVLGFVCLEIYFLRFSGLGQTDYLGRVQNNKRHRLFSLEPFDMNMDITLQEMDALLRAGDRSGQGKFSLSDLG